MLKTSIRFERDHRFSFKLKHFNIFSKEVQHSTFHFHLKFTHIYKIPYKCWQSFTFGNKNVNVKLRFLFSVFARQ